MKKNLIAGVLIAALLCSLLPACGGKPEETQNPEEQNPQEPAPQEPAPQEPDPQEPTERLLSVNKTEFFRGEEIYTTVVSAPTPDSWVGLFFSGDRYESGTVDALRRYYADRDGWWAGTTYGLQHSAWKVGTRPRLDNLPAGAYRLVLFGDGGYSDVRETIDITVKAEELPLPATPLSFTYTPDDAGSGLANGTVTVSFDPAAPASEVILAWADDKGPLEDYTGLATVKVSHSEETFRMVDGTIIPEGATRLLAFAKNNTGTCLNPASVDLPEGCGYSLGAPLSEFTVVSDIHINLGNPLHLAHFSSMCRDVVEVTPESDGVIVVGDIADTGSPAEWDKMEELRRQVEGLPEFYFSIGNHDFLQNTAVAVPAFKEHAETDSIYYDRTVNGYHHVFLGQETMGDVAEMSDEQLDWFDAKMRAFTQEDPKKPVFVYLHQSLYDTVAGGLRGQEWNGVKRDEELRNIVAKYPQIAMFNGHSHWDLNSYRNYYPRDEALPYIFNTASVAYLWSTFYAIRHPDNYDATGEGLEGSQGYYISVYADKLIVRGRDFVANKWIPSACYEAVL